MRDPELFAMEQGYIEPQYLGAGMEQGELFRDGPAPVPDEEVVARSELGFGSALGRRLRDKAISKVGKRDPAWVREVLGWIRQLRAGATFTTDSVAVDCGYPDADARAFGAAMMHAAKAGLVRKVPGSYVPSKRPQCHCRPIQVWERT